MANKSSMTTQEDSGSPMITPPISASTPTSTPVAASVVGDGSNNPPTNQADDAMDEGALNNRFKSEAWNHFTRFKEGELIKARCNYCKKVLTAGARNGTSHLMEHYKSFDKNKKYIRQQLLVKNVSGQMSTKSIYNFGEAEARKALAAMIVLHEYPLVIVDHVYFRKFSSIIQPLFKCPSRNTIKSDILNMFKSERKDLRKLIVANESRVAITGDMWTASNQKKGYMVVTAHFIDASWRMRSYILRFCYVPCPHTSEVLAKAIHKILFALELG